MTIDREFLELIRSEITTGISEFRIEVRAGFGQLSDRLDHTNARLDQTITRLDQTNVRLDATINMVRDFRKDVSVRFDEVGVYLRSINGSVVQHEQRISALEQRMNKLEEAG